MPIIVIFELEEDELFDNSSDSIKAVNAVEKMGADLANRHAPKGGIGADAYECGSLSLRTIARAATLIHPKGNGLQMGGKS